MNTSPGGDPANRSTGTHRPRLYRTTRRRAYLPFTNCHLET